MKFGVIGAGVTGLATALELSKAGHDVTIIERDQTPMPKTHDEAFYWDRR
ncbi:MAG: FAD-dependent oxidoreductase [Actinomycetota bacterium]|nr:FAD-dependent oxidoreductase [Actinomycetota bacterium]